MANIQRNNPKNINQLLKSEASNLVQAYDEFKTKITKIRKKKDDIMIEQIRKSIKK